MTIEHDLCKAFCEGLTISEIPAGIAVSTTFEDIIGDRITFYIIRDPATGLYRIEDDGSLVPELIAMGTKVTEGQRGRLFQRILGQARVSYDAEMGELRSQLLRRDELPMAALRFVSMMIRVGSLSSLAPDFVRNTFKEDAIALIESKLNGQSKIERDQPVSANLGEFIPDLLLLAPSSVPVAVFIGVSDARLYEAIFLKMAAEHEAHEKCSVVALIDRDRSTLVSSRMRQRAQNRLDAVPIFYGSKSEAVGRIAQELATLPRLQ